MQQKCKIEAAVGQCRRRRASCAAPVYGTPHPSSSACSVPSSPMPPCSARKMVAPACLASSSRACRSSSRGAGGMQPAAPPQEEPTPSTCERRGKQLGVQSNAQQHHGACEAGKPHAMASISVVLLAFSGVIHALSHTKCRRQRCVSPLRCPAPAACPPPPPCGPGPRR